MHMECLATIIPKQVERHQHNVIGIVRITTTHATVVYALIEGLMVWFDLRLCYRTKGHWSTDVTSDTPSSRLTLLQRPVLIEGLLKSLLEGQSARVIDTRLAT